MSDWDDILSAASRLQGEVREAVLVGGTAAALFAHHRTSYDADHVVVDLKKHFDEVLSDLESVAGWKTARIKRPVMILGSLDGVETGIRQLIRAEPLETTEIYAKGQKITVPTEGEILRIKGALILKRNATRDYLDFAALSKHLGAAQTVKALERFDDLYPQPDGSSATQQLCVQLASPSPYDREAVDFTNYKNIQPDWKNWNNVISQCQEVSFTIFETTHVQVQNDFIVNIDSQKAYDKMNSLGFKWALPDEGLHIKKAKDTRTALFTFHKYRVEHVSDTLRIFERIESSYAQTRTILDGNTVDGLTTKQLRTIENYGYACEKLALFLEEDRFRLTKDVICTIHSILAKDEAFDVGAFRSHEVVIERSCYTPPKSEHLDGIFVEGINFLNSIDNPQERAVCSFLFFSRSQFFSDCNKRTANLIMNGILIQNSYQPLTLKGSKLLDQMASFYGTADATSAIKEINNIAKKQYVNEESQIFHKDKLGKIIETKNEQINRIIDNMSLQIESQKKKIYRTEIQKPKTLAYFFQGNQWKNKLLQEQGRLEQLLKRRERVELMKNSIGQKRVEAMALHKLGLSSPDFSPLESSGPSASEKHERQQNRGQSQSLTKRIAR